MIDILWIHQRKGTPLKPVRLPASQDAESERMEGAPIDSRKILACMHQGRPLQHICRSLAREGQQGYFGRIDSVFAKPGQAIDNCPGLAAARAGHNKSCAGAAGYGFVLGLI